MEGEEKRTPSLAAQIAVLDCKITNTQRDVQEIKETLERMTDNDARERLALLMALISGWIGLIAAAIAALMHH